ncbi:MAG TPA: insulinase family protein, partial [Rhizobiales bacterium]|nr:insulinase family protein [Hyphomicrobiales bacterium]
SGVTAWLVEDHTVPLIAMKFSFDGGSASDPADRAGLANFLSGMLDEGAGDLTSQAFQQQISDLSIRLGFSAGRDRFSGSLQTLTVNRDTAFKLLGLALAKPRFDAAPLERVRGQIIVGIQRDLQKPRVIASRAWLKALIGDHPYARPSDGTVQSVAKITAKDLASLARRLLARQGLKVAVTGDIDAKTLKRLLDETFGPLPEKSGIVKPGKVTFRQRGGVEIIDRAIPQSVIQFGHKGILRDDKDFIAAYVMNFILGDGGFGSRLMREVREKRGLAYSAYSALYPLDAGGFLLGATATVNKRAGETVKVVRDVIARMAAEGPTQKELDAAKDYLTGAYALRFDSNAKIASQLLATMVDNLGIDYIRTRNEKVRAITLEDVKKVARRILKPDQLVFVIAGKPQGVKATN